MKTLMMTLGLLMWSSGSLAQDLVPLSLMHTAYASNYEEGIGTVTVSFRSRAEMSVSTNSNKCDQHGRCQLISYPGDLANMLYTLEKQTGFFGQERMVAKLVTPDQHSNVSVEMLAQALITEITLELPDSAASSMNAPATISLRMKKDGQAHTFEMHRVR